MVRGLMVEGSHPTLCCVAPTGLGLHLILCYVAPTGLFFLTFFNSFHEKMCCKSFFNNI